MEGLSAAASSIAVVSLAIQLAENIKKLCDFWNSIKDAPEDVRAVSTDLDLLSSVLTQIAYETQHVTPDATFVATLNSCCVKVKTLNTLLNEIEPSFASTSLRVRKWTAFKTVLRNGKLMKFQEALERLKSTLLLVQQNQYSRLSRNRHISLERSLVTITQGVSSLSTQQHLEICERVPSIVSDVPPECATFGAEEWNATDFSAGNSSNGSWSSTRGQARVKQTLNETRSVTEFFLGTIRAKSTTKLQESRESGGLINCYNQDQYEDETSYTIYPATWLVRLGIHHGLRLGFSSTSTQGWKYALQTFCPVPDDALIFEYCQQGNTPAVQSLLVRGDASVRDTDSRGYIPLHFAAQNFHPELCKFLKGAGADTSTLTHNANTPMKLASIESKHTTHATLSKTFDTLRLLTDSMDFLEENGDGWKVLIHLCDGMGTINGDRKAKEFLLLWMLRLSSFELKTYIIENQFSNMLDEATDLLLKLGDDKIIDVPPCYTEGYTLLHLCVKYYMKDLSAVLARGPDLHRLGFNRLCTPQEESPTSLAMYSSWVFAVWFDGLVDFEVDPEEFMDQELRQNAVVYAGWDKETLLDLLAYDYEPDFHLQEVWRCSECVESIDTVRVQPYWRHLLERIKQRMDPANPAQASSEADEEGNTNSSSITEAASSLSDPAHKTDATGNAPPVNLHELSVDSLWEQDSHGYPATIPIRSDCIYGRDDVICMSCWLYYLRTGTRSSPEFWKRGTRYFDHISGLSSDEYPLFGDDSSEDEYSPFHIHT